MELLLLMCRIGHFRAVLRWISVLDKVNLCIELELIITNSLTAILIDNLQNNEKQPLLTEAEVELLSSP